MSDVYPTTARLISSACDYLTCTVGNGTNSITLRSRAAAWLQSRVSDGYTQKPWAWQGYRGSVTDGISWGQRDTDTIVRLSGSLAARHANTAQTWADNVSRIDVQMTIQDANLRRNWPELCYESAQADARVQSGMTRTSIIKTTPRGGTCYIGSRSSDRMLRCYDKTAESDGLYPPGTWRFEIEYKRGRALNVARALGCSRFQPWLVAEVVQTAFRDYKISIPVPRVPSGWRDTSPREETDDQKRLAWLRRSIKPMVRSMAERYDWMTLMEAVGLADEVLDTTVRAPLEISSPNDSDIDAD